MGRHSEICFRSVLLLVAFSFVFAAPTLAGPPLICQPINIGGASSLPWPSDGGNLIGRPDYDVSHLVADTLSLLAPGTDVLVRMETLRRATIYAQRNPFVTKELLLKLHARTMANPHDALAAFDFGYCGFRIFWQTDSGNSGRLTATGKVLELNMPSPSRSSLKMQEPSSF